MTTWLVDGIEVESGGGTGLDLKDDDGCVVTDAIEMAKKHEVPLAIDPAPCSFPVDVNNDWMLHRYIQHVAKAHGLTFETDYKPTDDDMPPDVRKYIDGCKGAKWPPGLVF